MACSAGAEIALENARWRYCIGLPKMRHHVRASRAIARGSAAARPGFLAAR